jgi:hypothetical protein
MRLSGIMHKQADLLNSISNIRSGESKVLKSSSKTAVLSRISNRDAICSKLGVSVHGSTARFALTHTGTLQNVQHILALRKEQGVTAALNTDSQKMVKRTHISHRELTAEGSNDPVKKIHGGGSQHNIINVEEEKSHISTSGEDEQRRV